MRNTDTTMKSMDRAGDSDPVIQSMSSFPVFFMFLFISRFLPPGGGGPSCWDAAVMTMGGRHNFPYPASRTCLGRRGALELFYHNALRAWSRRARNPKSR